MRKAYECGIDIHSCELLQSNVPWLREWLCRDAEQTRMKKGSCQVKGDVLTRILGLKTDELGSAAGTEQL